MDDGRRDIRKTYDRIAEHFAATREYPWPEVERFCAGRHADVAVDLGCGNGRHAELLTDCADRVLAVDASRRLLEVAAERVPAVDPVVGDVSALPFADGIAGVALYVATLHHLPSRTLRIRSLDELARVLSDDGIAQVSAWSITHDRFEASSDAVEGFDTTVEWTLPGGETVPRFYHIYAPPEFDADLAASDLVVRSSSVSSGNCYAVVTPA